MPALTRPASLAGTAVVPPPGNGGAAVPAQVFPRGKDYATSRPRHVNLRPIMALPTRQA